jgi:prepilin-type N-terminal cleavage/methylation domain-containing protein
MSNFTRNLRERGFTLVELLIVVIILAILAAITIPQFANSAVAARESALDSNLATLRSAIELYRVQHNVYPGAVTAVGPACAPGVTGTGIATAGAGATASQAFIEQLSLFSNAAGATCTVNAGGAYRFGPYLRRGVPNDPIGGTMGSLNTGIVTTAAATPIAAPAAATGGWAYDTASGQILMNSNADDINGADYSTH